MARVKASERIRLSGGQVMTLGQALDAGLLTLAEVTRHSRTREDSRGKALVTSSYIARETGGDLFWDVGETLYRSRLGRISAVRELLAAHGCDCPCDHHPDERGPSCEVCLACRIGEALG